MSEAYDAGRAYGCVFCVSGKEKAVAQHIERVCDDVRAVVASQIIVKTIHGKSHTEEKLLYPGYVFFQAPSHHEMLLGLPKDENILSILASDSDWRLYGNDAKLVRWLFSYGGLLSFSQAYREGDWIRIISGPLLDLHGQIIRFDKRHKSAQIAVSFCGREAKIWLQFEIVDKI